MIVGTWNVENLYRPGGEFGPPDQATYGAKLAALADTITATGPDVLAVQEVGQPQALADLVDRLAGDWHVALSSHPDVRGIRVGFLSRHPIMVQADAAGFPARLAPVQTEDSWPVCLAMGRGALAVRVQSAAGTTVDVLTCHLKSKLISYPGGRFAPDNEGERARYGAFALYRRAAEAATVRDLADQLLDGHGQDRAVVVLGDLNDEAQAGSTQLLLGPPGGSVALFDGETCLGGGLVRTGG